MVTEFCVGLPYGAPSQHFNGVNPASSYHRDVCKTNGKVVLLCKMATKTAADFHDQLNNVKDANMKVTVAN